MLARWQHADNLSLKPEKCFELPPWWTNIWRCWKDVGSMPSMQEPAWDCVRGWRKILGCLKHEDIQVEISLSHWCVKRHSADSTWFRWYLQLVETLLVWKVPKAPKSIPKARARWCQVNRLVFLKLPTRQHEDTSTLTWLELFHCCLFEMQCDLDWICDSRLLCCEHEDNEVEISLSHWSVSWHFVDS